MYFDKVRKKMRFYKAVNKKQKTKNKLIIQCQLQPKSTQIFLL